MRMTVTHNISTYFRTVILVLLACMLPDIASAGVVYSETTGEWILSKEPKYGTLGVVTSSTPEDKNDKSGMAAPYDEFKCDKSYRLSDVEIKHSTLTGLSKGSYIVSLRVRAYRNSNTWNPSGISVKANTKTVKLSDVGTQFTYNRSRGYYADVIIPVEVTDGKIDVSLVVSSAECYWLSFKNLTVISVGKDTGVLIHCKGIVSEMGTPPEGLLVDYKTKTDDPRLADGVTLQRTHEFTHDIYVMPGAAYTLEPFSDFHEYHSDHGYVYTYIRWFDYRTDVKSSRLTSITDCPAVEIGGAGHFGGLIINSNKPKGASCITYTAPKDVDDDIFDIVAVEVSNSASSSNIKSTTVNSKTFSMVNEPTLQYRHIFVIHNAKRIADEISASTTANAAYVDKTRIKLMCPEGTPFQYPLPNYEYRGWGTNVKPTGYYYKSGANSYSPVYHYRIELLNAVNGSVIGSTIASDLSYKSGRTTYYKEAETNDEIEAGFCTNMKDNLVYAYKCVAGYDRVMYLKKPVVGKYIIKIYAIDMSSNSDKNYTNIYIYIIQIIQKKNCCFFRNMNWT